MVVRMLRALFGTLLARLRRGPLRPTWSFIFEVSIAMLRLTSRAAAGMPPQAERALWGAMRGPPAAVMRRVRREPVDAGGVKAAWFTPPDAPSDVVILYAHGGSFLYGSLDSHAELLCHLAETTGARVLALDYRLAPEHPFPAQLDDMLAAYRWLQAQGTRATRVVFAGDSAGGNLVVTSMLRARAEGLPLPLGGVALSPWVDLTRSGGSLEANAEIDWGVPASFASWAATYAAGHSLQDPLVSPLFAAPEDLAALPPLLLLSGEAEMLHDQIHDFVARAGATVTHVEYPDMVHNWMVLHDFTPEAPRAFARVADFVAGLARS